MRLRMNQKARLFAHTKMAAATMDVYAATSFGYTSSSRTALLCRRHQERPASHRLVPPTISSTRPTHSVDEDVDVSRRVVRVERQADRRDSILSVRIRRSFGGAAMPPDRDESGW